MIRNRVNFDYEYQLENNRPPNKKLLHTFSEFEYVYFLCEKNKTVLINSRNYSEAYLKGLERSGFQIPSFGGDEDFVKNWWGKLEDIDLEKRLNSKIVSATIALDLGIAPKNTKIISSVESLNVEDDKFILKSEFGFSGRGVKRLNQKSRKWAEEQLRSEKKMVMQPFLARTLDFGVSYNQKEGAYFFTKNIINSSGRFLGGVSLDRIGDFGEFLDLPAGVDSQIEQVVSRILKEGAVDDFQFDCFFYEEDGKIKLNPLVEINYRKTMGNVISNLKEVIGPGAWLFSKGSLGRWASELQVLETSPPENTLKSYYVKSSDLSFLDLFSQQLQGT